MFYVVSINKKSGQERVWSHHRKKECASKAALKLRCQSGIMGLRVVPGGLDPHKIPEMNSQ